MEPTAQPGWEAGALALREAARRRSTYVIVPDDPLAEVAAAWRAMWDVAGGPGGAAGFEQRAAEALAAWRDKRFELPDYYLVMAGSAGVRPGPVSRPAARGPPAPGRRRRCPGKPVQPAGLLDTLRSLEHGPWWRPLDELLDAARRFYAGGLAETQPRPSRTAMCGRARWPGQHVASAHAVARSGSHLDG